VRSTTSTVVGVDEGEEVEDDVVLLLGASPVELFGDLAPPAKGPKLRAAATPTNATTITTA
jgi:hypothetical protein